MHEHVGGGEPIGHPVGESLEPHPGLAREALGEALTQVVLAPAEADHGCAGDLDGLLGGPLEIADSPASPRDDHDRPLGRQTKIAPRLPLIARDVEALVGETANAKDARAGRDPEDLLGRLGVGDQVQVDAGVGPEPQRSEVGDRGDDRRVDPSLCPEVAERLRAPRVGGDHDVGRSSEDRSPDRPGGEPLGQPRREPACRRHVGDQLVGEVEYPVSPLRVKAGAVQDKPPHERIDQRQGVDDLDFGPRRLRLDPVREDPGGQVVALADGRAEDQDLHLPTPRCDPLRAGAASAFA